MRPSFIGVDGEGVTRDGRHDYTLLAASDSTYVETTADNGLSTVECLEYLTELQARYEGAILVGFFTSYDVNMLLRDVPAEQLARLWVDNECTWRPMNPHLPNYEQYRIRYVPNRVLEVLRGFWYWDEERLRFGWYETAKFVWWDVFQFFQASFVKTLASWKTTDVWTLLRIAIMKDRRSGFEVADAEQVRGYCFEECRLLVELMNQMAEALENAGIELQSWYGSGAIASALMKREGIKKHVRHEVQGNPETDCILRAYFGGRIETFAVGVNDAPTYNYDLRSAYPAAIVTLPSMRGTQWRYVDKYGKHRYSVWRVRWRCDGRASLTPFPYRNKQRIYWPRNGEGYYHGVEVEAALDAASMMGWKIEVLDGWVLDNVTEYPFAEWVPELYEKRAAYKRAGNSGEKPLKLGLNSLYGKTAQSRASSRTRSKDGKPALPPYRSFYWAGYITAWCRGQILRAAAQAAQYPNNLLAIATDGVFTRQPLTLDFGEKLGEWEATEIEPGLAFLQPGVYMSPSRTVLRTRGFSAAGITYDDVIKRWRADRFDASIEIPNTQFIGFGLALALNRLGGDRNIWRTWQNGRKVIAMGGTSTKFPDIANAWDAELIWLLPPDCPSQELSAPYKPKDKSLDTIIAEELDTGSMDAQPEMWDNPFSLG